MLARPTVTDTVRASIADLRSAHEAAVNRTTENARLRAELADQVVQRLCAEGERDLLKEQFHQAPKLDAAGQTLGDIAHEFNNILGVVLGFGELLRSHLAGDPNGLGMVGEIVAAGDRGRQLSERLSRAIPSTPRVEDWTRDCR
jgi:signal transduction histidine kinase